MGRLSSGVQSACAWFKVGSEEGAAALEYGLLAALIAVMIVSAVGLVGTNLQGVFNSLAANIHS